MDKRNITDYKPLLEEISRVRDVFAKLNDFFHKAAEARNIKKQIECLGI